MISPTVLNILDKYEKSIPSAIDVARSGINDEAFLAYEVRLAPYKLPLELQLLYQNIKEVRFTSSLFKYIDYIFEPDKALNNFYNYFVEADPTWPKRFFPIGSCDSIILLVCLGTDRFDSSVVLGCAIGAGDRNAELLFNSIGDMIYFQNRVNLSMIEDREELEKMHLELCPDAYVHGQLGTRSTNGNVNLVDLSDVDSVKEFYATVENI